MTNGSLIMQVKSIAECSHWSILQYFLPALSDNWSWEPIFGLFEGGHFVPVLLYTVAYNMDCVTCLHAFVKWINDDYPW